MQKSPWPSLGGSPVELTELLRQVTEILERLNIRYAVVGSVASSYYGDARLTNDIDIVADITEANVIPLMNAFPSDDFYLSDVAMREAIQQRSQFNIIHPDSGLKVDIIVPDVKDPAQLARRRKVRPSADASDIYLAAPEEVILKKMVFFQEGGSEKHLRDIAGVLRVSGDDVDRAYIAEQADTLGLTAIWQQILGRLSDRS